ncbi:MAG: phage shock protein PspA [Candidatus Hydrogenedentota bacterium]|nr:MAG: phage shock protein PspA [Candidatus Hydrogenedentota bacterium]
MGIFTRFRDIINSNINAMLDKAEDPGKLIRLMIQEMEDTLVELRASCADAIATKKRIQRTQEEALTRANQWEERAQLAVNKGREDLAREALMEKRRYHDRADVLNTESSQCETLIEQYQDDITQLEAKLGAAREKQRILFQRHAHAQKKKRAQMDIRRAESAEAIMRFEQFENRIERMEAEADLVNFGRKPPLEDEFASLECDEEIERELRNLKASSENKPEENSAS